MALALARAFCQEAGMPPEQIAQDAFVRQIQGERLRHFNDCRSFEVRPPAAAQTPLQGGRKRKQPEAAAAAPSAAACQTPARRILAPCPLPLGWDGSHLLEDKEVMVDLSSLRPHYDVVRVAGDGHCGYSSLLAGWMMTMADPSLDVERRQAMCDALPEVGNGRRRKVMQAVGKRLMGAADPEAALAAEFAVGGRLQTLVDYLRLLADQPGQQWAEKEQLERVADCMQVGLGVTVGYGGAPRTVHGEGQPMVELLLRPNHFDLLVAKTRVAAQAPSPAADAGRAQCAEQ